MAGKLSPNVKLLLDFAPLGVFFVAYRLGGGAGSDQALLVATAALIAVTAFSLAVIYAVERKVALAPLITGVLVVVFGGLTLALKDDAFIKLKPTIINLLFAGTLLAGAYGWGRGLLKYILDVAFQLREEGWLKLSKRWGFFFLFLAGLNEFIWRSFPTEFWVNFKVFGMFTLTILFAISQFRLIQRYTVQG